MASVNTVDSSKIIDNTPGKELVEVLKDRLKNCSEAKFAVGYFFLSGFNLVDEDFPKNVNKKPKVLTQPLIQSSL